MNDDKTHELTLEGVGSSERTALFQAVNEAGHDIPLQVNIDVSELTEERVDDLLIALTDVESELSSVGAHGDAEAASRMHTKLRMAAQEEGFR